MVPWSSIAIGASLASLASASWPDPPLSGHDFDFTAKFPGNQHSTDQHESDKEAPEFSTEDPPKDVVDVTDALFQDPVITLDDPDDKARKARYIAFLEISAIPSDDSVNNVLYSFPWIMTNMTVHESGELATSNDTDSHHADAPDIQSSEIRNATIQVWRQTDDLLTYIKAVELDQRSTPLVFALAEVFTNSSSDIPYDFKHASIDFKVHNTTADGRCDVNSNGAPIPGIPRGATSCPSTTSATATGKGSGKSNDAAKPSSSSKDSGAATLGSRVFAYGSIAMAIAGFYTL